MQKIKIVANTMLGIYEVYEMDGDKLSGKNYGFGTGQGALVKDYPMVDNKYEGECRTFHPDGSLESVGTFKNGLREGDIVSYFPSGKISIGASFIGGKRHGKSIHYYEDGTIKSEFCFNEDKCEGECCEYWPNGNLKSRFHYQK